jgi:hypothetical protein
MANDVHSSAGVIVTPKQRRLALAAKLLAIVDYLDENQRDSRHDRTFMIEIGVSSRPGWYATVDLTNGWLCKPSKRGRLASNWEDGSGPLGSRHYRAESARSVSDALLRLKVPRTRNRT